MGALIAKLLGSVLILGSTTYVGWQVAGGFAQRPRDLRDLQTALSVLQTEVEYGATPLPDALEAAGRAGGDRVGPLFSVSARRIRSGGGMTAGEAMRLAVLEMSDRTALKPEDLEIMLALAVVLGSTGRHDQVRHLQLALRRLSGEEGRAQEERSRYERVARYMGVLSGAALVLILI